MFTIIHLILFLLVAKMNAAYCEAYSNGYSQTVASCDLLTAFECEDYYEFSWAPLTYVPTNIDVHPCKLNSSNQCITNLGYLCTPACYLAKTGGPNGKFCSDFTTQSTCRAYYADHNGDRWCAWKTSTGTCYEALLCHN